MAAKLGFNTIVIVGLFVLMQYKFKHEYKLYGVYVFHAAFLNLLF